MTVSNGSFLYLFQLVLITKQRVVASAEIPDDLMDNISTLEKIKYNVRIAHTRSIVYKRGFAY